MGNNCVVEALMPMTVRQFTLACYLGLPSLSALQRTFAYQSKLIIVSIMLLLCPHYWYKRFDNTLLFSMRDVNWYCGSPGDGAT